MILIAFALLWQMIAHSLPAWRRLGWGFLAGQDWDPVMEEFGALPYIWGTVASSLLAMVISVPVSLGVAVLLSELAPKWLRAILSPVVELLAAVPSIVYGLWGMWVLVPAVRTLEGYLGASLDFLPLFQGPPIGFGMLGAGLILAIMVLPTIASLSRDVMLAVPNSLREAAFALGATRWEAVRIGVLGPARSGLLGASVLGLGRALGETMAVTMVIGNQPTLSASLFSPAQTIPSLLANEFAEAAGDMHLSALVALGLVLFGITLLLNIAARTMVSRLSRQGFSGKPTRGAPSGRLSNVPVGREHPAGPATGSAQSAGEARVEPGGPGSGRSASAYPPVPPPDASCNPGRSEPSLPARSLVWGRAAPRDPYPRRKLASSGVVAACWLSVALAALVLAHVLVYVGSNGLSAVNLDFFLKLPGPVGEAGGGMANAIAGSLLIVGLACLMGLPVGMGAGIYVAEFGKARVGGAIRFTADVLTGVPSIVIGVFVYTVVVISMHRFSAVAGAVALAVIMIPIVTRTTEEAIRMVPDSVREAGLALGLDKWKVTLRIVLREASRGMATGAILSVSRAAGETAPLLFTALGNRFWNLRPDQPTASLPVQLFTYAISPFDDWHRQAWAAAFVLVFMVVGLNLLTRLFVQRQGERG